MVVAKHIYKSVCKKFHFLMVLAISKIQGMQSRCLVRPVHWSEAAQKSSCAVESCRAFTATEAINPIPIHKKYRVTLQKEPLC